MLTTGSTLAPFIVALIFLWTPRETQLLWSYLILSAAIALTCVLPLLSPTPGACDKGENNPDLIKIKQIPRFTYYTLVGAVAFFLFLYVGAEVAYGGWYHFLSLNFSEISLSFSFDTTTSTFSFSFCSSSSSSLFILY